MGPHFRLIQGASIAHRCLRKSSHEISVTNLEAEPVFQSREAVGNPNGGECYSYPVLCLSSGGSSCLLPPDPPTPPSIFKPDIRENTGTSQHPIQALLVCLDSSSRSQLNTRSLHPRILRSLSPQRVSNLDVQLSHHSPETAIPFKSLAAHPTYKSCYSVLKEH